MTQPTAENQPSAPLTPAERSGRFVWHDLMTADLEGSLDFYTRLFGWQRRPWDMGGGQSYEMLFAGDIGIGGAVKLAPGDNVPAHWIGYLAVESVDRACEQAAAMDGTTCVPPTDIPTVGRFAVVEDPTGAVFSPFTPLPGSTQPEPSSPPAGTVAWNELMTSDPATAGAFYAALTGWTRSEMDMGEMGVYNLFRRGDTNAAGMMQLPADAPMRSHWLPYVAVAGCDASAAHAAELGGTILVPPTDIQDWGRFSIIMDPASAVFGVIEDRVKR